MQKSVMQLRSEAAGGEPIGQAAAAETYIEKQQIEYNEAVVKGFEGTFEEYLTLRDYT